MYWLFSLNLISKEMIIIVVHYIFCHHDAPYSGIQLNVYLDDINSYCHLIISQFISTSVCLSEAVLVCVSSVLPVHTHNKQWAHAAF